MDYNFSNTPPDLIIDPIKEYENSAFKDIRVEVLNGCGEKGIAKKFSDYLINQHVDVVRSENTPDNNFDYEKTQLILSKFKSHTPSSEKASKFLSKYL